MTYETHDDKNSNDNNDDITSRKRSYKLIVETPTTAASTTAPSATITTSTTTSMAMTMSAAAGSSTPPSKSRRKVQEEATTTTTTTRTSAATSTSSSSSSPSSLQDASSTPMSSHRLAVTTATTPATTTDASYSYHSSSPSLSSSSSSFSPASSDTSSNCSNNSSVMSWTSHSLSGSAGYHHHRGRSGRDHTSSSYRTMTTGTKTMKMTTTTTMRVPLPSPLRSRLDRQYAKRLVVRTTNPTTTSTTTPMVAAAAAAAATPDSTRLRSMHDQHDNHKDEDGAMAMETEPTPTTIDGVDQETTTSSTFVKIVPPPGIVRDHHYHHHHGDATTFFRPRPIVQQDSGGHIVESTARREWHESPRKFFFPNESPPATTTWTAASTTATAATKYANKTPEFVTPQRRRMTSAGTPKTNTSMVDDFGVSDRFIPSRATSNMNINLWEAINNNSTSPRRRSSAHNDDYTSNGNASNGGSNSNNTTASSSDDATHTTTSVNPATGRPNETSSIVTQRNLHNVLLRSELLGENINPYAYLNQQQVPLSHRGGSGGSSSTTTAAASSSSSAAAAAAAASSSSSQASSVTPFGDSMNRLRFQSPRQAFYETVYDDNGMVDPTDVVNNFSLTPLGNASSQRLMSAPQKRRRKIAKAPFKVLDAPALQDDFYLNLVDWSSLNVLAVGLGSCVYLWSACTSKVTKLCDLAQTEDIVTSVSWAQRGTHLAVGTNKGEVQLWDTIKIKRVRTMGGHSARVGTLAWSGPVLASGSRDRLIFLRDVRAQAAFTDRLNAHRQEVCGLRWSFDEPAFLASGGNDNQLHVVDSRNPGQPVHRFSDHTAAVKAIAWSPHQHGLLASGGGTADRCIRFWNTLSGSSLSTVDTGSQVCNLAWSQNCNEIVSTHGYSLNQIVVWRYPSLSKVTVLTGHTYRVLYLAVSPDGSTIVTGAGDETLRFWQVFPGPRSDAKNNAGGLLFPNTLGSVIR